MKIEDTSTIEANLEKSCITYFRRLNIPRKWSELSYAGETRVPPSEEPTAGSWPTFFLKRDNEGNFIDDEGKLIAFEIRQPDFTVDFEGEQLDEVKSVLKNITKEQIEIAKYWGDGPATKQWTPIIDILCDDIISFNKGNF